MRTRLTGSEIGTEAFFWYAMFLTFVRLLSNHSRSSARDPTVSSSLIHRIINALNNENRR